MPITTERMAAVVAAGRIALDALEIITLEVKTLAEMLATGSDPQFIAQQLSTVQKFHPAPSEVGILFTEEKYYLKNKHALLVARQRMERFLIKKRLAQAQNELGEQPNELLRRPNELHEMSKPEAVQKRLDDWLSKRAAEGRPVYKPASINPPAARVETIFEPGESIFGSSTDDEVPSSG